eukprot:ANDGO_05986.mRNA.1 hypothetical protein
MKKKKKKRKGKGGNSEVAGYKSTKFDPPGSAIRVPIFPFMDIRGFSLVSKIRQDRKKIPTLIFVFCLVGLCTFCSSRSAQRRLMLSSLERVFSRNNVQLQGLLQPLSGLRILVVGKEGLGKSLFIRSCCGLMELPCTDHEAHDPAHATARGSIEGNIFVSIPGFAGSKSDASIREIAQLSETYHGCIWFMSGVPRIDPEDALIARTLAALNPDMPIIVFLRFDQGLNVPKHLEDLRVRIGANPGVLAENLVASFFVETLPEANILDDDARAQEYVKKNHHVFDSAFRTMQSSFKTACHDNLLLSTRFEMVRELNTQLEKKREECDSLSLTVHKYSAEKRVLQKTADGLEKDLRHCDAALRTLQSAHEALEEENRDLHSQIHERQVECSVAVERQASLRETIQRLEQEVRRLAQQLMDGESTSARQTDELERQRAEVARLRGVGEMLMREKEQLQADVGKLESAKRKLEDSERSLKEKLQEKKTVISTQHAETQSLQKDKACLLQFIESFQKQEQLFNGQMNQRMKQSENEVNAYVDRVVSQLKSFAAWNIIPFVGIGHHLIRDWPSYGKISLSWDGSKHFVGVPATAVNELPSISFNVIADAVIRTEVSSEIAKWKQSQGL